MMPGAPIPDWRERYAGMLVFPREAMALVRPGDTVWMGVGMGTLTLCHALAVRAPELPGVTVVNSITPFCWDTPEVLASFRIVTIYAALNERRAVQAGRFDYVPVAGFRAGKLPAGWDLDYDVAAIPISPPDAEGWCTYPAGVWFNPTVAGRAKLLVGEVLPRTLRTGGDNAIHISKFARLAESENLPIAPPVAPRSEETVRAAEVICTLTAEELIPDGATLQIGGGDVSAATLPYLWGKRDLGIHTEQIPGGIVPLVRQGVVTGRCKEVHPGKVVGSFFAAQPAEDLDFIDGHPDFELYDFNYTDDMRVLLRLEGFTAVNNALFVDLTGNVCAESWGPKVFTGPGGQPTFAYAAHVTCQRSIIVLPSSQLVGDERRTRIMATLPEGSTITTHRAFVDYVVTEQGIACLSGKSLRERAAELISVAHPDFRAELRGQARKVYGVSV